MQFGSITRAAEELTISQPAVSRLISDLESEIGFSLFVRAGSKLLPTEEAEDLNIEVQNYFRGLESVYDVARDIKNLRRGRVRIAVLPNLSFDVVPEIISQFSTAHPGSKMSMDVSLSPAIVAAVSSRQVDIGFAQMPEPRPDTEVIASYRLNCVCALPVGHRLASRNEIRPDDLRDEPIVALSRQALAARHVAQQFLEADIEPNIHIESQPSFAACALVARGMGAAIVDPLTVEMFGNSRLVAIPFKPDTYFDFRVIRVAHIAGSRISNAFVEHAIDVLNGHKAIERI